MEIHCIGLSHKTAPLEYIEKAQMTTAHLRAGMERMNSRGGDLKRDLLEMVLLSTCNRTELYTVLEGDDPELLHELMANASGIPLEDLRPYLYHHSGMAALNHLMSVAAGLESMVIGEPQILGQVTDAYSQSISDGSSGLILGKCFHTAIH
ncbi:MAG: glutamyl-tRNA reductase, partial [Anaerolineales bacterium]